MMGLIILQQIPQTNLNDDFLVKIVRNCFR